MTTHSGKNPKYHNMYIKYTMCTHMLCITNTVTPFQNDAKEPLILIKLPQFISVYIDMLFVIDMKY